MQTDEEASLAGTCTGEKKNDSNVLPRTNIGTASSKLFPTPEPNSTLINNLSVVDADGVAGGSELRVAAQGGLGAGTDALEVLGGRQALVLDEVGVEEVDVAAEALELLAVGGQEGEDGHVAVGALVHVPLLAGDGGGGEHLGIALGVPAAVVGVSSFTLLFCVVKRRGRKAYLAIGPALMFASQIIISYFSAPPGASLVKRS